MNENQQDAQHPATATRLAQAARDGEAPKSHELIAAIQLTCGWTCIYLLMQGIGTSLSEFTKNAWAPSGISAEQVTNQLHASMISLAGPIAMKLAGILLVLFCCALLTHALQAGRAFGFKKPLWQPESLSPAHGIRRLLSPGNLSKAVLGIPKTAIILLVSVNAIWSHRLEFARLHQMPLNELVVHLSNSVVYLMITVSLTLMLLSVFEYLAEWFSLTSGCK